MRYIDVANDVALLAMDFDYQGRPDLSQQFTDRMVAALGDRGMLRLMDFYKCYRATIASPSLSRSPRIRVILLCRRLCRGWAGDITI